MDSKWKERHTVVLVILMIMVPVLIYIGNVNKTLAYNTVVDILSVILFVSLSYSPKVSSNLREVLAILGLANSTSIAIFMSHGNLLAHLLFGVILGMSAIYQDVFLYLLSALYIIVYYGFFAQLHPTLVFDPQIVSADIKVWSVRYAMIAILISLPSVLVAFIAKRTGESESILQVALSEAALRERQAVEIHDKVVQGLALSLYSLEEGDSETTKTTLSNTLNNAKNLVKGLMESNAIDTTRDKATGNIND